MTLKLLDMTRRVGMRLLILLGLGTLQAAVLCGCGQNDDVVRPLPDADEAARAAVAESLAHHASFFGDSALEGRYQVLLNATPVGIVPISLLRLIHSSTEAQTILLGGRDSTGAPTQAFVGIRKQLSGSLVILLNDTAEPAGLRSPVLRSSFNMETKPLEEAWWRDVLFRRSAADGSWSPIATTPVVVRSLNLIDGTASGPQIVRVDVHGQDAGTSFTDFSSFVPFSQLPRFLAGEQVNITVETISPDDVIGCSLGGEPVLLAPAGGNLYEGVIPVPATAGWQDLIVWAIDGYAVYDQPYFDGVYSAEAVFLPGNVLLRALSIQAPCRPSRRDLASILPEKGCPPLP